MRIYHEEVSDDKLYRTVWIFWTNDLDIILDEYREEHRESTRKRIYELDKIYKRIGGMRGYSNHQILTRMDIVVTQKVKDAIVKQLLDGINFK